MFLRCDTLVATNKNDTGYSESKKFYRAINDANRGDFKNIVNSPFLEISTKAGRILEDSPMEFALGVQCFLQGIGLLSALPLRNSFSRVNSLDGGDAGGGGVCNDTDVARKDSVIISQIDTQAATVESAQ